MGLRKPLKVGDTVPLALTFEKAGTIDVAAKVEAAATGPHPGASQTP